MEPCNRCRKERYRCECDKDTYTSTQNDDSSYSSPSWNTDSGSSSNDNSWHLYTIRDKDKLIFTINNSKTRLQIIAKTT